MRMMRFGMFFNQINPTLSVYVFVDLRLIFPLNVILMRIEKDEKMISKKMKNTFIMIFENGLKKFDVARQNLDGRAECWAQKNEKTLRQAFKNIIIS